jgi:hypothetical protein
MEGCVYLLPALRLRSGYFSRSTDLLCASRAAQAGALARGGIRHHRGPHGHPRTEGYGVIKA